MFSSVTHEDEENTARRCAYHGCNGELYRQVENNSYCLLHFPGKAKAVEFDTLIKTKLEHADYDFSGCWFPETADFENFHFEADAKFRDAFFVKGAKFAGSRFDGSADFSSSQFTADEHIGYDATNVNFEGTTFSKDCDFSSSSFHGRGTFNNTQFNARAYFPFANFCGPIAFTYASFANDACFRGAAFREEAAISARFGGDAQFDRAEFFKVGGFSGCIFNGVAEFSLAQFKDEARFNRCVFASYVDFSYSSFEKNVDFSSSRFQASVRFLGGFLKWNRTIRTFSLNSFVDLQEAEFEHPQKVTFQSVRLRPSWLIGTNPREFTFLNVEWHPSTLSEEIEHFTERRIPYFHRLLEKTFWDISKNQEENSYYEQASRFRFWAFDVRRRSRLYGWKFWTVDWWYWAVSGYGERAGRALVGLILIWIVFGFLYNLSGIGNFRFPQSMVYSLQVLLLQNPEPLPTTLSQRALYSLEKIAGPLQAALLALAMRRKFMR